MLAGICCFDADTLASKDYFTAIDSIEYLNYKLNFELLWDFPAL